MKQACSLESMVDAVLSEMKRRGNAKNTIERHERAYSQFYEYALTQGENSYSKVLARSFLEEKEKLSAYRGPRFMEQYRIALNKLDDIAKGQDIRLRHLENGYHLKSSCFDWVIPFFEERLKRRLKNTYDVRTRLRILSLFLSFIETQNAKKLEDISINHIAAAFEASTDQNHFRSTIREFLSFAAENGWMPTNLSCFVPKIRRHRGVPTVYSTDDIETCLASIDRTTQSGKRTYAVLLICARLGLRNTDACELKFSDIDWVKKTISIVQMKTGIPLVLPLLPEIEDAINRYIAARPQSDLSFIFLRHKAPYYGPQFNISAIAAGFQLNTGIAVIPTVANDVGIISVHGPLYCRDRIAVPYLNSLIENHVECLSECTNYFKCNFHPLHQATASLNCSHVISLQKRRSGTYRDCRKRDC